MVSSNVHFSYLFINLIPFYYFLEMRLEYPGRRESSVCLYQHHGLGAMIIILFSGLLVMYYSLDNHYK